MPGERDKWVRMRFGDIDPAVLGRVEDLIEITWPDLEVHYPVRGRTLAYRRIRDIGSSSERVAEIFRNGAYEMINNSEIDWHQDPQAMVEKVKTGNWNFYGCYLGETLIAAESLYVIRGDRTVEWVWGCVDPQYRGRGVWQNIGLYTDKIVELSGAQVGSVWVVTTHRYSQMSVERAGYVPMGCFIGKRLYGGADNRYYRHTLIHYAKLYGAAHRHLQNWDGMHLTKRAAGLVARVKADWLEAGNGRSSFDSP